MPYPDIQILCTRPLKEEFLGQAFQENIQIFDQEFIQIIPVSADENLLHKIFKLAQGENAVIFTSKNGVSSVNVILHQTRGR